MYKMKEFNELKVGERITVTLEVVEQGGGCKDCFFSRDRCFVPSGPRCSRRNRSDRKDIIFKEIK